MKLHRNAKLTVKGRELLVERIEHAGWSLTKLQTLPLPPDVRAAVDAGNDYVERLGENWTPELTKEWAEIHERMVNSLASLEEPLQRDLMERLRLRRQPSP